MWQKFALDFQKFCNFLKKICLNSTLFILGIIALSENVDTVLETSEYVLFEYVIKIFKFKKFYHSNLICLVTVKF